MNSFVKKTSLTLLCMTAMGILGGCGSTEAEESVETSDDVLNFVAVTSTAWDAEVTFGSGTYKLDVALKKDKTVKLTGKCVSFKESSGDQGGQQGGPGGDFGGGDFPGGFGAIKLEAEESAAPASSATPDLSAHDFTVNGTWSLEVGYGYDITFNNKVIHADYVKLEARHQFFYTVEHDNASSNVKFQAKDSDFRKTLAADWAPYHERNAEIAFCATAEGNNNSVDTAYFFLVKDGSTYLDKPSGSARSIDTTATWTKTGDTITVTNGTKSAAVEASIAGAEHEGYRLAWDSKTFLSCKNGSWTSMTSADFDGRTNYAFVGQREYSSGPPGSAPQILEVTLNCTDTGKFYAYEEGKLLKTGTYTFANEVFTITPAGEDPVTVEKIDGVYTYELSWEYEVQRGPNVSKSTATVNVVYTPAA